ncbi:MAG: hypothetical protein JNM79_22285 [Burkholderiales bacterium]|nr:hypothetical protein [Burkholderiales bacterium]
MWLARACLALVLAGSVAGCSTVNFAYTSAPTVLSFVADGYFDLDGEQESVFKERILVLREWLRTTQVAPMAGLLAEVRTRMAGTVKPEDAAWAVTAARTRLRPVGERLADELATIAPTLTAENVAAVRRRQAKSNAEFARDTFEATPEKRRARRFNRVREEAERWYGDFDDAQLEKLRALVAALPADYRLVLEDRRRRQAEFVAVLSAAVEKKADRAETRRRLAQLFTDWEIGRSAAYQAHATAYQSASYRMAAEIANLTTPAQRDTAQRRLQRWVDDLSTLAARKE